MKIKKIIIHRIISWLLVPLSFAVIFTGYAMTRGWFTDYYLISKMHRIFEWIFIPLLITHIIYTQIYVRANWSKITDKIRKREVSYFYFLRIASRVTSWLIIIFSFLVILSGLNGYVWYATTIGKVIPFNWHRKIDFLLTIGIILHIAIGLNFVMIRYRAKNQIKKKIKIGPIITNIAALAIISLVIFAEIPKNPPLSYDPVQGENPNVLSTVEIFREDYFFNTSLIERTRPDIFVNGSFSLFDVLVHLDDQNEIDMEYFFDPGKNTHIINSLNNYTSFWYYAYYSGGWRKKNIFRMDHYPWKVGTTYILFETSQTFVERVYDYYDEEIERLNNNNGNVIIPEVRIRRSNGTITTFENVRVKPHNLRPDLFQNGTITAIDIIMSLGDQGKLTYQLQWYDEIASAEVVRNYFITAIDDDIAHGTCGFVYETGGESFGIYNHIHIPADARVLNSPEYSLWFWICL